MLTDDKMAMPGGQSLTRDWKEELRGMGTSPIPEDLIPQPPVHMSDIEEWTVRHKRLTEENAKLRHMVADLLHKDLQRLSLENDRLAQLVDLLSGDGPSPKRVYRVP